MTNKYKIALKLLQKLVQDDVLALSAVWQKVG